MNLDIDSTESILRWIIGFVGIVLSIGKIRQLFARGKIKEEIKTDLEILDKIRTNQKFYDIKYEDKILKNIRKAYDEKNDGTFNLFYGIGIFVGFGLGTVQNISAGNTGWAIFTLILSFIGLGLALDINENKKENKELFFLKIGLIDKSNFFFATMSIVISLTAFGILIWTETNLNWGYFIALLFFIMGLYNFFKCFRRIN